MFSVFAAQSRTTTSGADAQENGLVALFTLERDIRVAGYGLTDSPLLSCATFYSYKDDPGSGLPAGPNPQFAPGAAGLRGFRITDGGAGSDSLLFQYATSFRAGVDATITKTMPDSSAELNVTNTVGFSDTGSGSSGLDGDTIVVVQNGNCTVMEVTQVQQAAFKIQHNPGQGSGITYNPSVSYQNSDAWPAYTTGAKVYNIGTQISHEYRVQNNNLEIRENGGAWVQLVRDIVNIQAQYGITDNPTSQIVTQWVEPTDSWVNPSLADYQRIKAIRIGVVARSNLRERQAVSPAVVTLWPNSTAGQTTTGPTYTVPDQNYRYKVYETVVPMRNVIWGGA